MNTIIEGFCVLGFFSAGYLFIALYARQSQHINITRRHIMPVSIDKTYKTQCGDDVKIYAIYEDQEYETVHGAISKNGEWISTCWRKDGRFDTFIFLNQNDYDLVEVKPRIKRTYWVNLYPNKDYINAHSSRAGADGAASSERIACVKREIDCEEGEGLNDTA